MDNIQIVFDQMRKQKKLNKEIIRFKRVVKFKNRIKRRKKKCSPRKKIKSIINFFNEMFSHQYSTKYNLYT